MSRSRNLPDEFAMKSRNQTVPPPPATPSRIAAREIVEDLIGCKWSLAVIDSVRAGIVRPGAMERHIAGISKKVLNERLRKLLRYGVLTRRDLGTLPLHVEYHLTELGTRLLAVLDAIDRLDC